MSAGLSGSQAACSASGSGHERNPLSRLEADAIPAEALFDPFVFETELDRIGQIRADLDERRTPVAVVDVEVVVIDRDGLPREVTHYAELTWKTTEVKRILTGRLQKLTADC